MYNGKYAVVRIDREMKDRHGKSYIWGCYGDYSMEKAKDFLSKREDDEFTYWKICKAIFPIDLNNIVA